MLFLGIYRQRQQQQIRTFLCKTGLRSVPRTIGIWTTHLKLGIHMPAAGPWQSQDMVV